MPRVILWPDTFNNHFHPQTAKAAVEVLEDAGFQVVVPRKSLCCGRPLYDFGMLETAKGLLREILDTLRPEIEASIPVVGLEPSCVAVFRDEMMNLFPMDEDAKRLSANTFILSEFLEKKAPALPTAEARAEGPGAEALPPRARHEVRRRERRSSRSSGSTTSCSTPAAAAWPARSGSRASHYDVSVAVGERAAAAGRARGRLAIR